VLKGRISTLEPFITRGEEFRSRSLKGRPPDLLVFCKALDINQRKKGELRPAGNPEANGAPRLVSFGRSTVFETNADRASLRAALQSRELPWAIITASERLCRVPR